MKVRCVCVSECACAHRVQWPVWQGHWWQGLPSVDGIKHHDNMDQSPKPPTGERLKALKHKWVLSVYLRCCKIALCKGSYLTCFWIHILTISKFITPILIHFVCSDRPYWFTPCSEDENTSEWSPHPLLQQALFYIITLCMQAWVWIMDESKAKQFNYPPSFCLTLLQSAHLISHGVNKH